MIEVKYCACCTDNECECEGTNLERDGDAWACTCCLSNDCECNGTRVQPFPVQSRRNGR